MLKHKVKEIPNRPISTRLRVHQGQLIMEARTKNNHTQRALRNMAQRSPGALSALMKAGVMG